MNKKINYEKEWWHVNLLKKLDQIKKSMPNSTGKCANILSSKVMYAHILQVKQKFINEG